jgi:3-isopropylmalate dehydrogenase
MRIALLPGDGIGPEVVAEAVKTLRAVRNDWDFAEFSVGACEYLKSGDPLPPATFEAIKDYDAVLLGAMGLPDVRWPNGVEMTPQLDLREQLDLYAGLRPIYLFHAEDSPLRGRQAGDIDFVIVRENTEGLFSSRKTVQDLAADSAEDRLLITRKGAERIARAAFEEARKRPRKRVALIDKANVLPAMAYFRAIFDRVAKDYPDVAAEHVYVDAASLYLVRKPEMFDVMVTENMYGDILSDLAAGLVGGMGVAPSADIGEEYGVFQPSHGSAPDIAGRGIANPVATILSAAMMLEWLGDAESARRIDDAVRSVLADRSARTPDMGGKMMCVEMGDAVASAV